MNDEEINLFEMLNTLKKHKFLILGTIILITMFTLLYSLILPPSYEATAQLLISSGGSLSQLSSLLGNGSPDLNTQAAIIRSRPIAQMVRKKLKLRVKPESLLNKIEVEVEPSTTILNISSNDRDARTAVRLANAFASAYISWSNTQSIRDAKVQRKAVEAAATEDLPGDLAYILRNSMPSKLKNVNSFIESGLTNNIGTLTQQLASLRVQERVGNSNVKLISPAAIPDQPSGPKTLKNTTVAFIVSFVLGITLAFLVEYWNKMKSTAF